jgi:hypothetical protein
MLQQAFVRSSLPHVNNISSIIIINSITARPNPKTSATEKGTNPAQS